MVLSEGHEKLTRIFIRRNWALKATDLSVRFSKRHLIRKNGLSSEFCLSFFLVGRGEALSFFIASSSPRKPSALW